MRYPRAEQIILVDTEDEHRHLNPILSRSDANVCARLGFI